MRELWRFERSEPPLAPDRRRRYLRGALGGFGELRRNFRGLGRRSPTRRLAAVTPGARPIEGVHAEFVHLLHLADPGRAHPIGVIVGRLVDFRQPELPIEPGD